VFRTADASTPSTTPAACRRPLADGSSRDGCVTCPLRHAIRARDRPCAHGVRRSGLRHRRARGRAVASGCARGVATGQSPLQQRVRSTALLRGGLRLIAEVGGGGLRQRRSLHRSTRRDRVKHCICERRHGATAATDPAVRGSRDERWRPVTWRTALSCGRAAPEDRCRRAVAFYISARCDRGTTTRSTRSRRLHWAPTNATRTRGVHVERGRR